MKGKEKKESRVKGEGQSEGIVHSITVEDGGVCNGAWGGGPAGVGGQEMEFDRGVGTHVRQEARPPPACTTTDLPRHTR